jgi:hypothetical protein
MGDNKLLADADLAGCYLPRLVSLCLHVFEADNRYVPRPGRYQNALVVTQAPSNGNTPIVPAICSAASTVAEQKHGHESTCILITSSERASKRSVLTAAVRTQPCGRVEGHLSVGAQRPSQQRTTML